MPAKAKTKNVYVKLQCADCKKVNYFTHKSGRKPGGEEKKLEMKKFCASCRKHTQHKESKK